MNLDEELRTALTSIVPVCLPVDYDGEEPEYIAYTYDERGGAFGDDVPDVLVMELTLHWYLPSGANPNARKRRLRQALLDLGFTCPRIVNASDNEGQHFVFECQREGAL